MEEKFRVSLQVAQTRHRREVGLYIFLPLGVSLLCVFALLFMSLGAASERFSQIAALAVIWLSLPLLLLQAMLLVLLFAGVYLLRRALRAFPGVALRAQGRLYREYERLNRLGERLVRPIFGLHQGWVIVRTIFDFRRIGSVWKSGGSEWKEMQ
jgi:hypothetical protein